MHSQFNNIFTWRSVKLAGYNNNRYPLFGNIFVRPPPFSIEQLL